jgi:hypothetical protein
MPDIPKDCPLKVSASIAALSMERLAVVEKYGLSVIGSSLII